MRISYWSSDVCSSDLFFDVALHLHLAPAAAQDALLVDQEAGALDAHVLAPVERLLDPGAVGLADLAVLVRGEGEGQVVLGLELVVPRDAVPRDADDGGVDLGEVGHRVAEAAGFGGAAGGVVPTGRAACRERA